MMRMMDQNINKTDLTPIEYFLKVAMDDLRQNKRISMSSKMNSNRSDGSSKTRQIGNCGGTTRTRFIVCTLGLAAMTISQMSRGALYLTITQMVEPESNKPTLASTEIANTTTPMPFEAGSSNQEAAAKTIETTTTDSEMTTTTEATETAIIDAETSTKATDQKGSVTEGTHQTLEFDPLIDEEKQEGNADNSVEEQSASTSNYTQEEAPPKALYSYPRYKWTNQQQNVLLGSFFYSYVVFMFLSGRMAEIYGAKYVLMLSVAGSGVINLATPWMCNTSFPLLVISRVVMGAVQAGVFPGMYALFAKWLTMTEASIFAPLIKMNMRLGMFLGSFIPGIISGWPNVFYVNGFVSLVWSLLWWAIATSDPATNKWVSEKELKQINRKKFHQVEKDLVDPNNIGCELEISVMTNDEDGIKHIESTSEKKASQPNVKKSGTPWIKILTAPSVIGLIIVKLTFNYALDFLSIELPTYLSRVHEAPKETISFITSGMFLIQVVLIGFVGWLAKVAVQKRPLGLNKTGVRKLFQGTASFGLGSFLSMFTSGGETVLPYDLSEEYPATIMAIANSFANLSAIITTTVAAIVLNNQSDNYELWNILMYLVAGANLIGGVCFTLLVKAEPIDFGDGEKAAQDGNPGTYKHTIDEN